MAQDMNICSFIGNLTRDPELRHTQSGISCTTFTIAVNRRRAQDGTQTADFPSIVAWRQLADLCAQYLHKGSKIAVTAHCQTRSYDKDGRKVYVTEFVADQVQFLTPRNQQTTDAGSTPGNDEFVEAPDGDSDDLPF